jgi:uncharacterized membrane protein YdbT with pleckstrin-like domain
MSVEDHLQVGEQVVHQAHVSRISLIPWLILAVALVAGGIVAFNLAADPLVGGLALLPAVAVVLLVLGKWVVLRSNEYILTDRRVIQQTGIVSKRSVDSRLDKINNVEHQQTLWGRLLGYGDVWIDTASETGTTMFRQIADPLEFKRAILSAAEAYRTWSQTSGAPVAAPTPQVSGAARLRELKALLDEGLISDAEFEAKRRELVSEL